MLARLLAPALVAGLLAFFPMTAEAAPAPAGLSGAAATAPGTFVVERRHKARKHHKRRAPKTTAPTTTTKSTATTVTSTPTAAPATPSVTSDPVQDAAAGACGSTTTKADGSYWKCTFADDFSGTALDTTKWTVTRTDQTAQHQNVDCLVDSPDNVSVADGTLRLSARKADAPFTCASPRGAFTTQWTGGMVTTGRKFAQAYGRYEIRAKFPDATVAGMHGALWLYPQDLNYGAWPASGEIDIAEHRTAMADKAVPSLHYLSSGADAWVTNWNCTVDASNFHTYGLLWAPGSITITVDGRPCLQKVSWLASNQLGALTGSAPFDKPFFLLLTQGAGVGGNSPVSQTPTQGTMQVDYVRVWN